MFPVTIPRVASANWLVGLEPEQPWKGMNALRRSYLLHEQELWQSLKTKRDRVAEMPKICSSVTTRRYLRRHECHCKCSGRWGPHSSLPKEWRLPWTRRSQSRTYTRVVWIVPLGWWLLFRTLKRLVRAPLLRRWRWRRSANHWLLPWPRWRLPIRHNSIHHRFS